MKNRKRVADESIKTSIQLPADILAAVDAAARAARRSRSSQITYMLEQVVRQPSSDGATGAL